MQSSGATTTELWLPSWRPWYALLGVRLRRPGSQEEGEDVNADCALLALPNEIIRLVLSRLPAHAVARAACTCKHLRELSKSPDVWRSQCLETWASREPMSTTLKILGQYRGNWRLMFLERLRLRYEGLYVSRNHYLRPGVINHRGGREVVLACYFRVVRFYPDGSCLTRTTASAPDRIWRTLRKADGASAAHGEVVCGQWRMSGGRVAVKLDYGCSETEVRWSLRLRSTCPGAMNRLDMESIVTFDKRTATGTEMADTLSLDPDGEGGASGEPVAQKTSAFCFVPFEDIDAHIINTPVADMDLWIPG